VLPDSANKLREPVAALLLGATLVYLVVTFALLFKDSGTYGDRAFLLQDRFVNPVWVVIVVLAALLVTTGERTPRARLIVLGVLAVLGLMALLGVISWVSGLAVDLDRGSELFLGGGKLARSFVILAELAVLAGGLLLTYLLFRGLPAPVRAAQTQQQQWGAPQHQQWGTQQQPWGSAPQQPWPGQQPSWGGGATAYGAGSPPVPEPAPQPTQEPAQEPTQPGPAPQSWGYPAPQPSPWQTPPPQQQPWSEPAPSQSDSTAEWTTPEQAAPQEPQERPPAERRDDSPDDSAPGWWPPRP